VNSWSWRGVWLLVRLRVQAGLGGLLSKVGLSVGHRAKALADYGVTLRERAQNELKALEHLG
jgi:hypothetical protein